MQTGIVTFGSDLSYSVITPDDLARLALYTLLRGLDSPEDASSIRCVLLRVAAVLTSADVLLLATTVRQAELGTEWEHFADLLEQAV